MEIRFYHLQKQTLDLALPLLLSKIGQTGKKVVVRVADKSALGRLDQHLWTYDPESFLPHGCGKDPFPEAQPVWLDHEDNNPASAEILLSAGVPDLESAHEYEMKCLMFEDFNDSTVQAARELWKHFQSVDGFRLTYWQQSMQGKWEKKASS